MFHFISYSRKDAEDFTKKLYNSLITNSISHKIWLDKTELKAGFDWDEQISNAIKMCNTFIFVISKDSTLNESVCKSEYSLALKYKKPIVPLLIDPEIEIPFRIANRQYIDFSNNFDKALKYLCSTLDWFESKEGKIKELEIKMYLSDEQKYISTAINSNQNDRVQVKNDYLSTHIIAEDDSFIIQNNQNNIYSCLFESQSNNYVNNAEKLLITNSLPFISPTHFQDRDTETMILYDFLRDDAKRIATIIGRSGIGKTAIVCKLIQSFQVINYHNTYKPSGLFGVICLSETYPNNLSMNIIFDGFISTIPELKNQKIDEYFKKEEIMTETKINKLLTIVNKKCLLFFDDFEKKISYENYEIVDSEIDLFLKTLLSSRHHCIKVIITSRIMPNELIYIHPERQVKINLELGLPSPYAENVLRELDKYNQIGLKTAPIEQLTNIQKLTEGHPKSLEYVYAILNENSQMNITDIFGNSECNLPQRIVEVLAGEAFCGLDEYSQFMMQVLAIYERPVSIDAIKFIMNKYVSEINVENLLQGLVNNFLIKFNNYSYFLHNIDREYALSRLPSCSDDDFGDKKITKNSLYKHAANYYRSIRKQIDEVKCIEDLMPYLCEIDMRFYMEDYYEALNILFQIDIIFLRKMGRCSAAIELYERFVEKVNEPALKSEIFARISSLYAITKGNYEESINYKIEALRCVRSNGDIKAEVRWLQSLGISYAHVGKIFQSINCYNDALKLATKYNFQSLKGNILGNLANRYASIGKTSNAIQLYKNAIHIAKESSDYTKISRHLCNMSNCYCELGKYNYAISLYNESLSLSKKTKYQLAEAMNYLYLGIYYCFSINEQNNLNISIKNLKNSMEIADNISYSQIQNKVRCFLSLAFVMNLEIEKAHIVIQEAQKYKLNKNKYRIYAHLGLILLNKKKIKDAKKDFLASIKESDILISFNNKNYKAIYYKGFSICGLMICDNKTGMLKEAKESFKNARKINNNIGMVNKMKILMDQLMKIDNNSNSLLEKIVIE